MFQHVSWALRSGPRVFKGLQGRFREFQRCFSGFERVPKATQGCFREFLGFLGSFLAVSGTLQGVPVGFRGVSAAFQAFVWGSKVVPGDISQISHETLNCLEIPLKPRVPEGVPE